APALGHPETLVRAPATDGLDAHPVLHAPLAGGSVWVHVLSDVLLGQAVDPLARILFLGERLDHASVDTDVAVGVVRIQHADAHPRVAGEVERLGTPLGGVQDDVVPVYVHPHR